MPKNGMATNGKGWIQKYWFRILTIALSLIIAFGGWFVNREIAFAQNSRTIQSLADNYDEMKDEQDELKTEHTRTRQMVTDIKEDVTDIKSEQKEQGKLLWRIWGKINGGSP